MKLKLLLVWAPLFLFGACGFKTGSVPPGTAANVISDLKIDPNADSDGDGTKDGEEAAVGRNPFVAELPDLKVRFLQNYKIEVTYHKVGTTEAKTFEINTDVKDTNPDFKFRVGNVFARNHALKTAASFGRFSSHTQGVFAEHDLSWVSYPELDPKFFHGEAIKYRDVFNDQNIIDNIKITLTNQARLNDSPFFKEIKNLKLNFYFLNHETENYEVLSSTSVDRHFQSGIYESFDVVIDHAPVSLLKEGFFKRGEFIISEVDDFEISALATNYKSLLASVKAKSIPVLYETPLEEKIYYVATNSGVSFQNILKAVFDKNYEVKEDALLKIGQFQNNLPDFTHLKEVKDSDKLGKWFVMTNEFKENYLDHGYTPADRIILSYITGNDLSVQTQESVYSYVAKIDGNKSEAILPLGNVTPNSKVEFTLHPLNHFGTKIIKDRFAVSSNGESCGKNCTTKKMSCTWDVNAYSNYDEGYTITPELDGEGEKLDLVINGEAFHLKDLIKNKKVLVSKVSGNVHLSIADINKIKELKDIDENNLALKVRSTIGNDFFGVKLVDMTGEWGGIGGCPFNTPAIAEKFNTQVSKDTRELGEISWLIGELARRGYPYRFSLIDSGTYYQEISLGVSSSIENYYN